MPYFFQLRQQFSCLILKFHKKEYANISLFFLWFSTEHQLMILVITCNNITSKVLYKSLVYQRLQTAASKITWLKKTETSISIQQK